MLCDFAFVFLQETTSGPDLLALHSCSICHEIFINENDLLDHSISMHTIGTTVIEKATENVVYDELRDENSAPNNGLKINYITLHSLPLENKRTK